VFFVWHGVFGLSITGVRNIPVANVLACAYAQSDE